MPLYVLLPRRGLKASERRALDTLIPMGGARSTESPIVPEDARLRSLGMSVIDSVHEDGPKLVELSEGAAAQLEDSESELHLEPLRSYRLPIVTAAAVKSPAGASNAAPLRVQVTSAATGAPVPGARVTALTSFAAMEGAEGITDGNGYVNLALGGATIPIDKVYVTAPLAGYWGGFIGAGQITNGDVLRIESLAGGTPNVISHFFGFPPPAASPQIKIGVIDTGIGPHPDLAVAGGFNTVTGEPRTDFNDNGVGHGTHVAGIISGDGGAHKGVAPGVTLLSYRAFGQGSGETTNYAILKALIYAVDAGCDIVNLSLAGEPRPDPTLDEALKDAKRNGTLVVMAAGNDFRKPVSYPAAYADQTGMVVSAMGRSSCFPKGACECDIPTGADADNFVAPFTNVGSGSNSGAQVSYIAPGVGVVSTVPGGHGVMSGTSMAAPAISGIMARILTRDLASPTPVLYRPRDSKRVLDMIQLADARAVPLGFGQLFEGRGLPQ